ncbi:hypothetical protein ARMSODRAFT_342546 [Armillaria solidipes]|uniref:Uncharacterized protein n=1 Tax=Armillaria solidipes TaxID=1076256 RepID=A0A2H3B796_9AGAR|nr:hypothetical protein ARMSODRAFT_342546 [Armillaria solidipes]
MTQPPNDSDVVEARPAWFAPVQEQIDRLEGKLNGLMSDFNELLIDDRKFAYGYYWAFQRGTLPRWDKSLGGEELRVLRRILP